MSALRMNPRKTMNLSIVSIYKFQTIMQWYRHFWGKTAGNWGMFERGGKPSKDCSMLNMGSFKMDLSRKKFSFINTCRTPVQMGPPITK